MNTTTTTSAKPEQNNNASYHWGFQHAIRGIEPHWNASNDYLAGHAAGKRNLEELAEEPAETLANQIQLTEADVAFQAIKTYRLMVIPPYDHGTEWLVAERGNAGGKLEITVMGENLAATVEVAVERIKAREARKAAK
jgi:hypothetical protein